MAQSPKKNAASSFDQLCHRVEEIYVDYIWNIIRCVQTEICIVIFHLENYFLK